MPDEVRRWCWRGLGRTAWGVGGRSAGSRKVGPDPGNRGQARRTVARPWDREGTRGQTRGVAGGLVAERGGLITQGLEALQRTCLWRKACYAPLQTGGGSKG